MNDIPIELKEEAINEQTFADRLRFLASLNEELARLVASNLGADSELLVTLASSRDFVVKAKVASNPNTPPNILWKLAGEFPQEFLNNPILPLLPLEDPSCVLNQSFSTLLRLLNQNTVPKWILLEATKFKYDRVVMAVAKNLQIDDEVIEKLIATQNKKIQLYLIQHPNISSRLLQKLSESKTSDYSYRTAIRAAVAKHLDTPPEVLEKLAFDSETQVKKAVASRSDLSIDLIAKMARDRQITAKKFLLRNKYFSAELLKDLAGYQEPKVLQMVALHPHTPLEILKELASVEVASGYVAQSHLLNGEIIEILIESDLPEVYFALAKNHQTPAEILANLALQLSDVNTLIAIAENKNASETTKRKVIEKLLGCSRHSVISYVARNPYTPESILISWSASKYYQKFYPDLAQNSSTPQIVLDRFARKKLNHKVALGLVKNSKLSADIIENLYKKYRHFCNYSYCRQLYLAIARNPNTSSNILDQVKYDNDFYLAQHSHTSEKTLIYLSKDYRSKHDLILLQHPNLPSVALENILNRKAKSFYISDRKFTARYPHTPISLLEKLAQDKDAGVRKAAQYRLEQYNNSGDRKIK